MLILGMHSIKGGVGRTTAACMLGLRFAQEGLKVLLVDTDFEAPTLDMVLRVHPELFGKRSENGIDHLLKSYRKQRIQDDELTEVVRDVGETWRQSDWLERVRLTMPATPRNGLRGMLDRVVASDGSILPVREGGVPGHLYVLPCSRDGETNLKLNYGNKSTATSLDQGISEFVGRIGQARSIDLVLIDMRNGTSDAAALAGQSCHGFITVLLYKYIQVSLLRSALFWYLKTQRWFDRPIFSLYSAVAVPDSKDKHYVDHGKILDKLLLAAFSWPEIRSEWLTSPSVRLLAGKLPFSESLHLGDFFLPAYLEAAESIGQTTAMLRQQASILSPEFQKFSVLVNEGD